MPYRVFVNAASGEGQGERPYSWVKITLAVLAGVAAATVLAERGVKVVLVERERFLGGRAGAWTDNLGDGTQFQMERGFHAFFRQYYNVRALFRRFDPELSFLKALEDYPILGPGGQEQSFHGLPVKPPWNVIALTRQAPTLGLLDLMKVEALPYLEDHLTLM